jgi:hypothetical protein
MLSGSMIAWVWDGNSMKTVVTFGDTFGAELLVPLDHAVHLVTSFGMIGLDPVFDMMDEIIAAGIRTPEPFTCDPRPYDFEALPYDDDIKESVLKLYANQDRYEAQLLKLGLKDADSFSCASYLPEGGNTTATPQGENPYESKNVELGAGTQLRIESMNPTPRTMSAFNCNFPRALRHPR